MLLMEVKEVKGVSSLCSHQGKLKDNSFAVRFKAEKYTTSQWHRPLTSLTSLTSETSVN